MLFSEDWLRTRVNPPVSSQVLQEQLTIAGLEVDGSQPVAGDFDQVYVGHVISVEPHPDADKLNVCKVDAGQDEQLTIVCGASNVHQGMRAPVAVVGAVLPGGLKIKRAKLRGVESFGMLCSEAELGMAESADGLMALPADAETGLPIRDYLELNDTSIEVDLTPNRGDCLSVEGIAREVAVMNEMAFEGLSVATSAVSCDDTFSVKVSSKADCPRYVGRVIKGINVKANTPLWMSERLRRSGLRCISPTVDITNYVLMELGQPMHAFDLSKLQGGIDVRMAAGDEKMTLLDGTEVTPDTDTLVIADASGPVALAGIMGGESTCVDDNTQDIFLECAYFNPVSIAGRARRYGLHTDSSHRFERGVDFELQNKAIERATELMLEIAGGQAGPLIECVSEDDLPQRMPVTVRRARVARLLGMDIEDSTIEGIFNRLSMSVTANDEGWMVTPPGFRFDIEIEADLIEEIVRIIGFDNVPTTSPVAHLEIRKSFETLTSVQRFKECLVSRGYQEAITYSFIDPAMHKRFDPENEPVALSNPISADLAVMRTSLLPGLSQALVYNQNRQQQRIRLFENGLTFVGKQSDLKQESMLSGIVAGPVDTEHWDAKAREVDFYDVKGDVEALLSLGGGEYRFIEATHPALHPGQTAAIIKNDKQIGLLGAIHPELASELSIDGAVFLFELNLTGLQEGILPHFEALSRFPAIRRDLALVVDEAVTSDAIRDCIGQVANHVLKNLQLFDVYRGEGIDSGRKSMAIGLTLQSTEKTLTDEEVDTLMDDILNSLSRKLGANLRG